MRPRILIAIAALLLALNVNCAREQHKPKPSAAHLVIPRDCIRELDLKRCTPDPTKPDWCSGRYDAHFVCTKVEK